VLYAYEIGRRVVALVGEDAPSITLTYDADTRSWSAAGFGAAPPQPVADEIDTWDYLSTMGSISRFFGSVRVLGSRLVFAGGISRVGRSSLEHDLVDILDPADGSWSRQQLGDRTQYVAGAVLGETALFVTPVTLNVYDATDGTMASEPLPARQLAPPAVTAAGRFLLAAGGQFEETGAPVTHTPPPLPGVVDTVRIFDTAAKVWTAARLSQPRRETLAVSVGSLALFIGGYDVRRGSSDVVDLYDAATDTWRTERLGQAGTVAGSQQVALGQSGMALMLGGEDGRGVSHIALFDGATGDWWTPALSIPRWDGTLGALGTTAVVAGGTGPAQEGSRGRSLTVVDFFDLPTRTQWSAELSAPRAQPLIATVGGRLLIAGGGAASVDIYDGASRTWRTAPLSQNRSGWDDARAVVIGSTVLFVGLTDSVAPTLDIYDADSDTWNVGGIAVKNAVAPLVVGGQVIWGSSRSSQHEAAGAVAIYDSATGEWSVVARPITRNAAGLAVTDRWAVCWSAGFTTARDIRADGVEVYDTQTGQWTVSRLPSGLTQATAVAIGTRVVFAPDEHGYQSPRAGADVLDVATGAWTQIPLRVPRNNIAPVASDGRVFLVGGSPPSAVVDILARGGT
jgi:hypothetical protein